MSDENTPSAYADNRQQKLADILTALRDQHENLLAEEKQLTDAISQLTADRIAAAQKRLRLSQLIAFLEKELHPKAASPAPEAAPGQPCPAIPIPSKDHVLQAEAFPSALRDFFAKRGYSLTSGKIPPQGTDPLYKFAKNAIGHLKIFEIFRHNIGSCNIGESFSVNLSTEPEEEKVFIANLCKALENRGVVTAVRQNDTYTLTLRKKEGTDQITGRWGEFALTYLLRSLRGSLQQENTARPPEKKVPFHSSVLCNLILTKPGQTAAAMELDVALLVNNSDLYIFESKCGKDKDTKTWRERTLLFETPPIDPSAANSTAEEIQNCRFYTVVPLRTADAPPPEPPLRLLTFDDISGSFKQELRQHLGLIEAPISAPPPAVPPTTPPVRAPLPISGLMKNYADFLKDQGCALLSLNKEPNPFHVKDGDRALKIIEYHNVFGNFRNLTKNLKENKAIEWDLSAKTDNERKFILSLCQHLSSAKKRLIHAKSKKKTLTLIVLNKQGLKDYFVQTSTPVLGSLISKCLSTLQSKIGKNKSLKATLYTNIKYNTPPTGPALPETILQINDRLLYVFDTFLSPGFTETRCNNARELTNKAVRHIKKTLSTPPAGPYICRFIAVPWQTSPSKKTDFKGINTTGAETFVNTVSALIRQDL